MGRDRARERGEDRAGERRARRTQAERRAHTHGALIDATIDCLVERGYGRTSTNDIIRIAGVSRGALLHHFASKAELLGAAAEFVFERCEMQFREAFAALPVEDRTLERAVGELWAIFRSPSYDAALELVVASRTDAELRAVLVAVLERFERSVAADFGMLFPATAAAPDSIAIVRFAFAVLDGAALSADLGFTDSAEATVAILRALADIHLDNPRPVPEQATPAAPLARPGQELTHEHGS
ncbi:MAG TPA: TetR family transcriptional regulator [Acidimicrobiales bacterium]|jgi:AcrR family transcriptional regulator|nr:TetR family transcriptional regulator [Acidimicrobiales bacterium]